MMCRVDSNPFFLRKVEEARQMRLESSTADGADYEEPLPSPCCEGAGNSKNKEGNLSSYCDVAVNSDWEVHTENCIKMQCGEEDDFEDVVLQLADEFEEEVLGDLYAGEDDILSSLPSAARLAASCLDCETADKARREHIYNVLKQHGRKCLSPCAIFKGDPSGRYADTIESSITCGAALPSVSAGLTYSTASTFPWSTPSKHAIGAFSRSGSEPLRLKGELEACSLGCWHNGRGAGTTHGDSRLLQATGKEGALPKNRDASAAVALRSVGYLRRSCSSPLPPLGLSGKQLHAVISAVAEYPSPPHLYCPKPQEQAQITHSQQALHTHPDACVIADKSYDRRRCNSEVASHHNNFCSTRRGVEGEQRRVQKRNRPKDLPSGREAAWGAWAERWYKLSSSYRRRGQKEARSEEVGSWAQKMRSLSCGSWFCSSKSISFGHPECRRMAFAFLFMLLSLSAEVLLLRLAAGNITEENRTERDTALEAHGLGESAGDFQLSQAILSVSKDNVDENAYVDFDTQPTTSAAGSSDAGIERSLWQASNIVYVIFLFCSLLRFLLLMSPGFAPVACVRLMTCVSVTFLSRGLWVWCFALETSAWHLGLTGWSAPWSERPSRNAVLYSILDGCGIWAFAPELRVDSFHRHLRHASVAAGTLYSQSLVMSILVCFWGIYTSKRWIISYLVVPGVATMIWALRISASYLSAAAATATVSDATTVDVLYYFPASEATPCLLIYCFVVLYHLILEAAVQKHVHVALSGSKSNSIDFPLRALFDRCYPCALLQNIIAFMEGLPARVDRALGSPPVAEPNRSNPILPVPFVRQQMRTGQSAHARACYDAAEPRGGFPASPYVCGGALQPLRPPCFPAIPCLSSSVDPRPLSKTHGPAGNSRVACEVTWRKALCSRRRSDAMSISHDTQYIRHHRSPNWKTKLGSSGSACCVVSTNKCGKKKEVRSIYNDSACTIGRALSSIPDWGLQEATAAPQCLFYSCIADVGYSIHNKNSPPRLHQSREGLKPVLEPHSDATPENGIGRLLHLRSRDALLQRITLLYAGSGDFDLHLLRSLFQRCIRVFHKKPCSAEKS